MFDKVVFKPHQVRVIEELESLTKKVKDLALFMQTALFDSQSDENRKLLEDQHFYMSGYKRLLDERIALFNK